MRTAPSETSTARDDSRQEGERLVRSGSCNYNGGNKGINQERDSEASTADTADESPDFLDLGPSSPLEPSTTKDARASSWTSFEFPFRSYSNYLPKSYLPTNLFSSLSPSTVLPPVPDIYSYMPSPKTYLPTFCQGGEAATAPARVSRTFAEGDEVREEEDEEITSAACLIRSATEFTPAATRDLVSFYDRGSSAALDEHRQFKSQKWGEDAAVDDIGMDTFSIGFTLEDIRLRERMDELLRALPISNPLRICTQSYSRFLSSSQTLTSNKALGWFLSRGGNHHAAGEQAWSSQSRSALDLGELFIPKAVQETFDYIRGCATNATRAIINIGLSTPLARSLPLNGRSLSMNPRGHVRSMSEYPNDNRRNKESSL